MKDDIKILIVDDEPSLLDQAKLFLEKEEGLNVITALSAEEGLELLDEEDLDVVVSDYQMPEIDGLEFLEEVRDKREMDIPFIMFTGKGREEVAMDALNLGADRYLKKGGDIEAQFSVLAQAISQEFSHHQTEKKLALTKNSIDKATTGIFWIDPAGRFVYTNRKVEEILGYSEDELQSMYVWEIDVEHEEDEEIRKKHWQRLKEKRSERIERKHETKEGEVFPVEVFRNYIKHGDEELEFAFVQDITERKKKEKELREERNFIEQIAETSPVCITKVDKDGDITYANNRAEDVLGLSKSGIQGRTYDDTSWNITDYEVEEYPVEELPFEQVKEKGESVYDVRHAIEWPDGERKLLSINAAPLYDEEENFDGMVATIEDVTEEIEKEEELKESEERYRRLFESAQDGMLILDARSGMIIDANPFIRDMLGYSLDELKGKKLWEIGTFSDIVENREKFDELREEGYVRYEHLPLETKDGDERAVEFVSNLYMVGEKEIIQCNIRDITERKKMEEKEEFLHSLLRHDIGNKWQIAYGYLQLTDDYDLPREVEKNLSKAKRTLEEGNEIIEKVRGLRNLDYEEEIGEMNIDAILDEVISGYKEQLEEEGIIYRVEKSDCQAKGGPLLKDLFSNLVENSIRHSDCEKILIKSKIEEDGCVIIFEDDGKGLSDDMKEKIFDRGFKQGESSGSGLGLYMVKEIVESYGGSVEVKDSKLGGARFDVILKKA